MKILRLMVIGSVALALIVTAGLYTSSTVEATTITLSDLSSEPGINPSDLSATLEFSVSDSRLTLTVTNNSNYTINEVYFNATSNVTGLTLSNSGSWSLSPNDHADGFGTFDFALTGGEIASNGSQTQTFEFAISGTGPFSQHDFTTELSTIPPGGTQTIVAAKFVKGPNDNDNDSAYGAVPEPSTVFLLGAGLIGLALVGRIRFKSKPSS